MELRTIFKPMMARELWRHESTNESNEVYEQKPELRSTHIRRYNQKVEVRAKQGPQKNVIGARLSELKAYKRKREDARRKDGDSCFTQSLVLR